jgi:hypothetical protein
MNRLASLSAIAALSLTSSCGKGPYKDFDVISNDWDPNGMPFNPKWGEQINPFPPETPSDPTPADSCPIYSDDENQNDWTSSPQYPHCTSYPVYFNGAVTCGAHVNFMPVCYEGSVVWDAKSYPLLDDEYTLNVTRDDRALYTTRGSRIHIEFDSDETVDNWDDTGTWWDNFHHNGVDQGDSVAHSMIDGKLVIVLGLLGLDANHDGKSELHPVYAMFVRLPQNDVLHSSWAFFVRNWGNEGFCGDNEELLQTYGNVVKFHLPDVKGLVSSNVWRGSQNTDNLSPMVASMWSTGDGVDIAFTLLDPDQQSWFVGDLNVTNQPPRVLDTAAAAQPRGAGAMISEVELERNPHPEIEEGIAKLSESSRKELYALLRDVTPRRKPVRTELKMLAHPATTEEAPRGKPGKPVEESDWIRQSKDASGQERLKKRIEIAQKYLADHSAK